MSAGLVDTHAHLHDRAFDADRALVVERARAAGVGAIVTVGTDVATSASAVATAHAFAEVWATVGVHPHDASTWGTEAAARIRELAADGRVVAIGEIGLDFYRDLSPRPAQRSAFAAQLELAGELGLPVVVHAREADTEVEGMLREWVAERAAGGSFAWPPGPGVEDAADPFAPLRLGSASLRTGFDPSVRAARSGQAGSGRTGGRLGVLHCFSGDAGLASRYAELGFLVSFAGVVTYPKNLALREAAQATPAESIVVETDCPYLTPQFRRGKRNEPAYVAETARFVAELRGEAAEAFAARTTANAARLFGLAAPATLTP